MGVQTIGEAYQSGLGPEGSHEEGAGVLRKGGTGPTHPHLDTRQRVPTHQPRGRAQMPDVWDRRVSVIFDVPSEPAAMRIAGMPSR